MGQLAGQNEWLLKLYQYVQHVRPRWLRKPATNVEMKGSSPRPSEPHMEHLQADRTPLVREQLRDEELLVLIGQGDEQALGALYDRHGALVYSMALHITGARRDAEVMTQDVFQRVWQHAHGFGGGAGSPSGWLVGLARASALEKRCSQQGTLPMHTTAPGITAGPSPRAGANLEETAGLRDDVRAAVAALPVDQRQALERVYYGRLTTRELAAALDVPDDEIKTRLRLGLLTLRDVLEPRGPAGAGVRSSRHSQ